ncbi:hypothetical protein GCM10027280_22280 [Micromonospora polyrhachis]
MKLRRPYMYRVLVLLFGMLLLAGAVSLPYEAATQGVGWVAWLFCGAVALFGLAMGGRLVRQAALPFRVDVDSQGWSIRTPRLNRHLRWDEIAAVVLADAPRSTASTCEGGSAAAAGTSSRGEPGGVAYRREPGGRAGGCRTVPTQ